jgi:nicotinamidase/pyrazinamidase
MGFIIDRNHTASFDVDCQKGFSCDCPEELPVSGAKEIVRELNRQAKIAKYRIGSKDAHPQVAEWMCRYPLGNGQPTKKLPYAPHQWVSHCVVGTEGFELLDGLPHPLDYDFFVWKGQEPDVHPYGACYHDQKERKSTGVIEWMKTREVHTVVLGGIATDYCLKTTAIQVAKAGFETYVNLKACRGIDPVMVERAKHQMETACITLLETLKDLTVEQ